MPLAQDHLAAMRKAIGAVLRRHGFRVRSKREWTRGDDDSGWVVVAWRGDKWNTKQTAEAWLDVSVWPPGTREHHSRLLGTDVAAYAAHNSPVVGPGQEVVDRLGDGTFAVKAGASAEDLAALVARAETYADALAVWAVRMLDAEASAPLMDDRWAVAALLARHPDSPDLDPRLDLLTAEFQRDPRPIALQPIIRGWRRERGLPDVPLPDWSRHSRPHGAVWRSPRDELLAGVGTGVQFLHADGTVRPPRLEDLPDAGLLDRWRDERDAAPLPDGVLTYLPAWLPYAAWLDLPQPEETLVPARRRWWRR